MSTHTLCAANVQLLFQSEQALVKSCDNLSDIALSVSLSVQLEMPIVTQCNNRKELVTAVGENPHRTANTKLLKCNVE